MGKEKKVHGITGLKSIYDFSESGLGLIYG